jgi:hypothetical protein
MVEDGHHDDSAADPEHAGSNAAHDTCDDETKRENAGIP